jgi:3-oxoacyl-[acyl-carrier protein] reductase
MSPTPPKGKNAIVTGAAGGVGSAVVKRFVEEGMNVLATVAREAETPFQGVIAMKVDVTSEKEVEALFARGLKEFGSIDIVVNTVGGYLPEKPISEVTLLSGNQ